MLLCGLPFFGQAGGQDVSFVDSATSTSSTITIPATAQVGDIAVILSADGSGASLGTPSGFSSIQTSLASTTVEARASRRVLQSGDPGSALTVPNASATGSIMLVFRPASPGGSLTIPTWGTSGSQIGNPTGQTVAASGQTAPLVVIGFAYAANGSTFAFSTASPAFDATVAVAPSNGHALAGYKVYGRGSTPADHSIDMNDQGNHNSLLSGLIQFG